MATRRASSVPKPAAVEIIGDVGARGPWTGEELFQTSRRNSVRGPLPGESSSVARISSCPAVAVEGGAATGTIICPCGERRTPCVEHRGYANARSKVLRVHRDSEEGLG